MTFFMGARNLFASLSNFSSVSSVSSVTDLEIFGIWCAIAVILAAFNARSVLGARNRMRQAFSGQSFA